jgi:ATP/maltotriose-dependent transcriptional regulator MalT
MEVNRKNGDPDGANWALLLLGHIALAQGDLERAAAQLEASEAWFRQSQQRLGLCAVLHDLGYVRHLQGDDQVASEMLREALTLQRKQQLKLGLITSLERSNPSAQHGCLAQPRQHASESVRRCRRSTSRGMTDTWRRCVLTWMAVTSAGHGPRAEP